MLSASVIVGVLLLSDVINNSANESFNSVLSGDISDMYNGAFQYL